MYPNCLFYQIDNLVSKFYCFIHSYYLLFVTAPFHRIFDLLIYGCTVKWCRILDLSARLISVLVIVAWFFITWGIFIVIVLFFFIVIVAVRISLLLLTLLFVFFTTLVIAWGVFTDCSFLFWNHWGGLRFSYNAHSLNFGLNTWTSWTSDHSWLFNPFHS